jgi:hypothetical protein
MPLIGARGGAPIQQVGHRNAWIPFRRGSNPISIQELWEGYNENLDFVFDYVEDLLNEISGKVVLSADHGNMVGERQRPIPTKRMFGHPWGVYTPELVKVPWFVINGERRTITSEPPTPESSIDRHSEDLVEQRLQSLGYKD